MHLAVYPPHGRIRLAAPLNTDSEVMRLFAISKLGWIKKHVKNFQEQARETPRDYVSGESHHFQGRRYLLNVVEQLGKAKIEIKGTKTINLYIRPGSTRDQRSKIMKEWYRKCLKEQLPELLEKWEDIIGVKADEWGVKQMKTKWGACNIEAKRIWINLELAKKPLVCLEYIVVHELVHLLERNHTDKFIVHMNTFMPKWRLHRDELNSLPVVHNDWGY
ncbi:M48 family metallopeptidase [Labilibaculum sp. DW002]|uniref:M48 family metallopeptidase n=1 Tax=Paralabilibaculum antarcticum TaxID=2912572 RepID=A0ABT5VT41_9BACT|nr:SprT family zinc-dependent metalloprotease [Labilibaculum sp. DW002]MDE5418472.1 M48 family metallopeptidase [Labilibaculum sp. DW002]